MIDKTDTVAERRGVTSWPARLAAHLRAWLNRLRIARLHARGPRADRPPGDPMDRLQLVLGLIFVSGWGLVTWGAVIASGADWLWQISGGVLLMAGAVLLFWAAAQEAKRRDR